MSRLFRKGDRVSVAGTVKYDQQEGETVFVEIFNAHNAVIIPTEIIKLVAPRVDIGERVFNEDGEIQGVVRGIYDEFLWVEHSEGYDTWKAASVTVIQPSLPLAAE